MNVTIQMDTHLIVVNVLPQTLTIISNLTGQAHTISLALAIELLQKILAK